MHRLNLEHPAAHPALIGEQKQSVSASDQAMQSLAHATKDNEEAIDAFIEKRAPVFRGE